MALIITCVNIFVFCFKWTQLESAPSSSLLFLNLLVFYLSFSFFLQSICHCVFNLFLDSRALENDGSDISTLIVIQEENLD